MSRVGKEPVAIPGGVNLNVGEELVAVKGPKGEVSAPLMPGIKVEIEGKEARVLRSADDPQSRANHGLVRALVANAVTGVSEGFKRELDIIGVGYRAEVKGREVVFSLGYSHPVLFPLPEGIDVTVEPKTNHVTVTGIDKQVVGQVAAEIRSLRPPDVYKGKGIRYTNEVVRKKAGKAAGK